MESYSHNTFGVPKVVISQRPIDTTTTHIGKGDSATEVGEGTEMLFSLASTDDSISKTYTFIDDIYLNQGIIFSIDAPFGANFSLEILNDSDVVVGRPIIHLHVFGDNKYECSADDVMLLPQGYKIKMIVNNSSGEGDEDAPAAFKIGGYLKVYR